MPFRHSPDGIGYCCCFEHQEISACTAIRNHAGKAKVERVRISAYMGSSITSKTELDKGIKKLREHLEKLLEEGKTVILE